MARVPARSKRTKTPAAGGWRELVAAFAAAVAGERAAAARALAAGFAAGLRPARAREAFRMVHLFAGFPRNLTAFEALGEAAARAGVPLPTSGAPDRTRAAAGRSAFEAIYGSKSGAVRAYLRSLDPAVARWIASHAYARVLSRPGLAPRARELLAVAALVATRQERQLISHVLGARRCGASEEEVKEAARLGALRLRRLERHGWEFRVTEALAAR